MVNRGAYSFTVLPNDGNGGFSDPSAGSVTTSTIPGSPSTTNPARSSPAISAGRTNRSISAILMENRDEVWIYLGHGDGTFTLGQQIPVGSLSTGPLAVGPDGTDLLVGNTSSATSFAWSATATAPSRRRLP